MVDPTPCVRFATTINYRSIESFTTCANDILQDHNTILDEIKTVLRILRTAKEEKVMLLDCSSGRIHPDLMATIIMRFWRKEKRPIIIFFGDMWQRDPGIPGLLQKLVLKRADKIIHRYVPHSSDEIPIFAEIWGISPDKLRFCPYLYTFSEDDLKAPAPPIEDFIFAGGNTHRDYTPLVEAMEHLPDTRLIIASNRAVDRELPPNVTMQEVNHKEFVRLLRASRAVVVPVVAGLLRSAGQQTYLNSMLLGKATIVPDILGIRDHALDNSAIIVEGTPESYARAIEWVLAEENQAEVAAMCERAQRVASENFNPEAHIARLLSIIESTVKEVSESEAAGN